MSEELKLCPFCGGDVQFHKDEECSGCHLIQCGQCRAFFDFATGADPENNCESVDALRGAIVPLWNRRVLAFAQPVSDGGQRAAFIAAAKPYYSEFEWDWGQNRFYDDHVQRAWRLWQAGYYAITTKEL